MRYQARPFGDCFQCEGSPRELLPRIFEPFRPERDNASRGDGLGLGLFIAKAIARAHGGGLEVKSENDETMFRLVLPRQTPASFVPA
jgi:signal transduction histidine kinase